MMGHFWRDRASHYLDQSRGDVPCRVRFAGDDSLMSLSKWGGEASLRFGRGEEHRGSIQEAGKVLILKPEATPKQHHIFRKLDGNRFEYDVILLREPDSNRVDIDLDFPDGLEFIRQPSYEQILSGHLWCEPEVIDSYAVYWKRQNGQYRTGKFCHIYRPLIYDAAGRKIWGKLGLNEKRMTITIPQNWLADAVYPVVIDPVIGTETRGASRQIDWYNENSPIDFYLELEMGLNRYTASSLIYGACTAYIYSYMDDASLTGQAAVFTNSGTGPQTRLSRNETLVSLATTTPGWKSASFTLPQPINPGETFWFGFNTPSTLFTYFDYTGNFRKMRTEGSSGVPESYTDDENSWNIRMSMYFSYTDAQNFTRTCYESIFSSENIAVRRDLSRACAGRCGLLASTGRNVGNGRLIGDEMIVNEDKQFLGAYKRICGVICSALDRTGAVQVLIRYCRSGISTIGTVVRSIGKYRLITGWCGMLETIVGRLLLKKDELIFVSRLTREIEFRGYLV